MRLNRMCGGGDGGRFDLNGDGACSMGNYGGFQYLDGRPIGFIDNGERTYTEKGRKIFNAYMEKHGSNVRINENGQVGTIHTEKRKSELGSQYAKVYKTKANGEVEILEWADVMVDVQVFKPFEDFGGQEKQQSQFYFGIEDELTVGPQASVNIKGALGANLSPCKWSIYSLNFNNIDGFTSDRMGQNKVTKVTQAFGISFFGGISYEHSFMGGVGYALDETETHMIKYSIFGIYGREYLYDEKWNLKSYYRGFLFNPEIGLIINGERKFKFGKLTTYK